MLDCSRQRAVIARFSNALSPVVIVPSVSDARIDRAALGSLWASAGAIIDGKAHSLAAFLRFVEDPPSSDWRCQTGNGLPRLLGMRRGSRLLDAQAQRLLGLLLQEFGWRLLRVRRKRQPSCATRIRRLVPRAAPQALTVLLRGNDRRRRKQLVDGPVVLSSSRRSRGAESCAVRLCVR